MERVSWGLGMERGDWNCKADFGEIIKLFSFSIFKENIFIYICGLVPVFTLNQFVLFTEQRRSR